MRLFVTTTFFIALIILCNRNIAQGALIKKDVSQHPIHISAVNITTWQKDGVRIFSSEGNVKIEQGDIQITSDSTITWFSEIKITQFTEGHMEVYCDGNVSIFQDGDILNYQQMYLKLTTTAGVVVDTKDTSIQSFEEEKKTGLYLQGEKIRAEGREEFVSTEVPQAGVPSESVSVEGEPIDITADDIDTWIENDVRVIVAIGNVKIERGDDTLNADNVILYFDQKKEEEGKSPKQIYKEVYAEGNVTLRRESDVMIAEKMFENIIEDKGIAINSVIRASVSKEGMFEKRKHEIPHSDLIKGDKKENEDTAKVPLYVGADEIKHVGKGQYDMKNGFFSICSFGHPHFRFQSSNIRLFKTEQHSVVSTRNNVFYAENIPLMYIPFDLSFDTNRRKSFLKNWETGRTSRFGPFIKTDWDLYSLAFGEKLGEWSDLTLSLDYLERRGPGAGLDFEYAKPDYFGYMNTYYINDDEDFDINNVPVENNSRGHFLWRHRQFLANDWRADVEISHVADRSYYREFHEAQLKQEKDRETMLYLRKIYDNKGITLLARKQLRSYDTLVDSQRLNRTNETLPELKYRIIGEPVWKDRLNFTSENELAYQDRVIDRIAPIKKSEERFLGRGALLTAERVFDRVPVRYEPKETVRIDTNNTINAPFHLWNQRFNPYIGARFTGYSESVSADPVTGRNEGGGTARGRMALPIGFDTSTTLSRTYSIYNKFLNINRLRHILIPEVRFAFIPIVSQDPEDLNQFDGTDALDTYQAIRFGVRNRFQTKYGETGGETPIDFASFNIAFNLFPGNAGLNRKLSDYIGFDLMLRLSDKLRFLSENNEFNLDKGGFDIVNLSLGYDLPKWNFFIRSRFIDDISSSVALSSEYSLSEKWRIGFSEQYEFKSIQRDDPGNGTQNESQNLSTSFVLSRYFHEWIGKITLDVNEIRSNTITRFDIIPRGAKTTRKRFWF